jgi:hypothetical protein
MTVLNIFRGDAFSEISLTSYVEKHPFQPTGIGELDMFEPLPIRTTALAVEQRQGKLIIIPTSPRGAPATERTTEKRQMRYFDVPRLFHGDTLYASELQNVREFGQESVLMQVQTEVARRLSGPTGLQASLEFTRERHRLSAIQGILLDADGSVIFNWFNEFGITQPTEIGFNLAAGTAGTIRPLAAKVERAMARAAQGAWTAGTQVMAACGDAFWDALVDHPDVIRTFVNWNAAQEIREPGTAFESMKFAGINWFNYRGSDDNDTVKGVAIPPDKVKFFPKGAPGVFQQALAPGESAKWINTPGKPEYVIPIPDRDRDMWWRQELYSYPLHICTRPEMLESGRMEA